MDEFSPERALAAACAATGLRDFGDDGYREGLSRELAAFGKIPLTAAGKEDAFSVVVADLKTRLLVENWIAEHPASQAAEIEGPLLVTGLPRTGTTATVAMLALDPRFRFLRGWEGRTPVPPPVLGAEKDDARAAAARQAAKAYADSALHLLDPDGPEEDLALLAGLNMRAMLGRFPMPDDYVEWWIEDSFRSTYAYHERVLKLLQSSRPPRHWLLKAPPHLFKLEAFVRQYPQAKIVMTHRDPAKVIASVSSLYQTFFDRLCGPGVIPKAWTGARCLAFYSEGVRRGLLARARLGEDRFADVWNRDVVRDPIGTFERLYDGLGLPITDDLRAGLQRYQQQNAPGRFGEHSYTAEEYGLTDEAIRAAFKDYVGRFDL